MAKKSAGKATTGKKVAHQRATGRNAGKGRALTSSPYSLVDSTAGRKALAKGAAPMIVVPKVAPGAIDKRMKDLARDIQALMNDISAQWAGLVLLEVLRRLADVPARTQHIEPDRVDKMADALVNTLVGYLASESPEEDLGPFYSTTGLTRRLNVSRQALDGRVTRHTLLALPGDDGSRLYPLFQFTEENGRLEVIRGLAEVMQRLAGAEAGPMLTAAWLTSETAGLDEGRTVVEHLREGGGLDQVLELADADIARWAS